MRSFNGHVRGLSILLGSMASSVTRDGPCGVLPVAHYTVLADVTNAANETQAQRKLSITVTLPAHGTDSTSWQISRSAPYPVIFFFNGFLLKPAYYGAYANRLATWGYAVVQYDTGRWPILKDRQELPFFPQLIDWLSTQSELKETIDLEYVGVAGHSRGAKLAALHFASGRSYVKAAFLVDPVDNTRETPESVDYPSAAKALKSAKRPVGIAGASVITSCNPAGSNWGVFTSTCSIMLSLSIHCDVCCILHACKHLNQGPGMQWLLTLVLLRQLVLVQHFWPSVSNGSWLLEVNGASHNTFLRASWLVEKALDLLCKRGPTSHEDTIGLTMPAMTAWMDKELRGVQMATMDDQQSQKTHDSLLDSFYTWVQNRVELKLVEFTIKGSKQQPYITA